MGQPQQLVLSGPPQRDLIAPVVNISNWQFNYAPGTIPALGGAGGPSNQLNPAR